MASTSTRCEHETFEYALIVETDAGEVTSCCHAQYSVFTDTGEFYCKCCYAEVGY